VIPCGTQVPVAMWRLRSANLLYPCCFTLQVGGRLEWRSAGLTVNTTNSTLYEQFIEALRPRTGYALRLSLVYRSSLRSVWPSSIQHTFFTSGRPPTQSSTLPPITDRFSAKVVGATLSKVKVKGAILLTGAQAGAALPSISY